MELDVCTAGLGCDVRLYAGLLQDQYVKEIGDVVKVGQTVKVTIIPSTDGRLSFTMRYTSAGSEGGEESGKDLKRGKVATRGGAPSLPRSLSRRSLNCANAQQAAQCKCF